MPPRYLGVDIGTSGVRTAVVNEMGAVIGRHAVPMDAQPIIRGVDAMDWWRAVDACLLGTDCSNVVALAVDGTSGSMVLVNDAVEPVTQGFLYDSGGFDPEAEAIALHAPVGSITRGSGSALARLKRLQSLNPDARILCHQADFAVARLTGRAGLSDESNALKTGYDPVRREWPAWLVDAGVDVSMLPEVRPVGSDLGAVSDEMRARHGFAEGCRVVAGASDSVAAFLAAGATKIGTAVTSLGTTMALKVLSDGPVEDAAAGVYSHRIGDAWLPGGASNVGGGVLLDHFAREDLEAVSQLLNVDWQPEHPDTYPLKTPGERFPVNDPVLPPVIPPRDDDARFLFELLHAMARIERRGYEALGALGAPYPIRVLTAGGGSKNAAWTAIRERVLGVPVEAMTEAEAAVGMARLARTAMEAR